MPWGACDQLVPEEPLHHRPHQRGQVQHEGPCVPVEQGPLAEHDPSGQGHEGCLKGRLGLSQGLWGCWARLLVYARWCVGGTGERRIFAQAAAHHRRWLNIDTTANSSIDTDSKWQRDFGNEHVCVVIAIFTVGTKFYLQSSTSVGQDIVCGQTLA